MGDCGGLVFIWPFPLFYALYKLNEKRIGWKGLAVGFVAGLTFWLCNLSWLLSMADLNFVPLAAAATGWLALSLYLAVYFAIFGWIVAKWGNPWREPKPKVYTNRIDAKIAAKLKQQDRPSHLGQSFRESLASLRYAFIHASLWTILEWLRSVVLTGFSWNGLGVAFYDIPVLAQSAELVGVIGLSFAPIFVASVLFQLAGRMIQEASKGRMKPHFDMAVAGLLLAGMFGFGVTRLYSISNAPSKEVSFLLVQQNMSLADKHNKGQHVGNMINYQVFSEEGMQKVDQLNAETFAKAQQEQTLESFQENKVDIVMWPESAVFDGLRYIKDQKAYDLSEVENVAIGGTLALGEHYLISGANDYTFETYHDYQFGTPEASHNSIVVFDKKDNELNVNSIYKKNHLVMFGEYIPLRETFPILEKIVGGSEGVGPNFLSGGSTEPLSIQHQGSELQLIGSVCFEDTVGRLTRKSIRSADQIIINVTNDGWFGESQQPRQHFANALFRTIELRRPMVRSANTGISCIINAKGSIENEDGSLNAIMNKDGNHYLADTLYAKARVLTNAPITLYALAGDWFVILCAVIFVFSFLATVRKRAA